MTVTDLQRQQAKTPRHTTKTKTGVKAASNTSILTGGKAGTKVSISYFNKARRVVPTANPVGLH